METYDDYFVCPSCDKPQSTEFAIVCEDSEELNRIDLYTKTLVTTRKYKFYCCRKCGRAINTLQTIQTIMILVGGLGFLVGIFADMAYLAVGAIGLSILTMLVLFIWRKINKVNLHISFEKAKECYALLPYDTATE